MAKGARPGVVGAYGVVGGDHNARYSWSHSYSKGTEGGAPVVVAQGPGRWRRRMQTHNLNYYSKGVGGAPRGGRRPGSDR